MSMCAICLRCNSGNFITKIDADPHEHGTQYTEAEDPSHSAVLATLKGREPEVVQQLAATIVISPSINHCSCSLFPEL